MQLTWTLRILSYALGMGALASSLLWPHLVLAHQPKTFLLVWASDKGTDDGHQDPDFLAVIDADRR
jgi:hypothetical protein